MSESDSHKRAKNQAPGKTEVLISGGRRLDSASPKRATEVERSGSKQGLDKAAQRLKDSGRPQKVLQVPHRDLPKARQAIRDAGISGTVKNLGGTKSSHVPKARGSQPTAKRHSPGKTAPKRRSVGKGRRK